MTATSSSPPDLPIPSDARPAFIALARLLMAIGPSGAENGRRVENACAALPPDSWLAMRGERGTTYMRTGESGRFSATAPGGVDVATLPVLDERGPAPTDLRDFLDRLGDAIVATEPLMADRLAAIARSVRSGDELATFRGELMEFVQLLARAPATGADAFAASETSTRKRFIDFEIAGALASVLLLLARIARTPDPSDLMHRAMLAGGRLDIFDGPQNFCVDMLVKIRNLDGGELAIANASAALQAEAEALVAGTAAATAFGAFYGAIFESIPLAYGAQQGFAFLSTLDVPQAKRYKILANVCDERVAPAMATMGVDFHNSLDWRALTAHRSKVAAARAEGGDHAAEQLVAQYIDLSHLYPPFTRDFLLGKTDELRLRV